MIDNYRITINSDTRKLDQELIGNEWDLNQTLVIG